jgi:hypothetical protein
VSKLTFRFQNGHPTFDIFVGITRDRLAELQKIGHATIGPLKIRALLDTGASVVNELIIRRLGLESTGTEDIFSFSAATAEKRDLYDASVIIAKAGEALRMESMQIAAGNLTIRDQGFEAVVGRDILSKCRLEYDGRAEVFSLEF